jgi:integrase
MKPASRGLFVALLIVDSWLALSASPHLRRVERTAPDMAKKVRQWLRGILDHAVEDGLVSINPIPAPRSRKGASDRKHLPARLTKDEVGDVLRRADKGDAGRGVKRAHLLAAFTAQRIGEIAGAEWSAVDMQSAVWSIPRDRMKRKDAERGPHLVPIPPQLLARMCEWRRTDGDGAHWVCPGPGGEAPITREAVEKFYRRSLQLTGSIRHTPGARCYRPGRMMLARTPTPGGAVGPRQPEQGQGRIRPGEAVAASGKFNDVARGRIDRCT